MTRSMTVSAAVAWCARVLPGLVVAAVGVGASFALARVVPVLSPLTIAVVLGVLLANLGPVLRVPVAPLRPGLALAAKRLLRAGVVLLGLRLAVADIAALGWRGVAMVVVVMALTFFGTQLAGRWLGLSPGLSLLVATGFSVCGASAVAAMDPVARAKESEVVTAIALVTLCGTLAIGVLPLLQSPLGLSDEAFGMWVGASVHDVAQVVATAAAAGAVALAAAVVVKLTRVVLLAPLVAGVGLARRRTPAVESTAGSVAGAAPATGSQRPPVLPLFVVLFLLMVGFRSTGLVPAVVVDVGHAAETILLAAALFGLGAAVHLPSLARTGGRAALLGFGAWIWIAGTAYAGVRLLGM